VFTIPSNFIGHFKTGDNICHNLRILKLLYRQYNTSDSHEKILLSKPIILILISIIEACLHDFHMRVRTHTIEGISNLDEAIIEEIRISGEEEFGYYIANAKTHDLFDMRGKTEGRFYERLDQLRKLRNRIHIQNIWGSKPPDEYQAFTEKEKVLAEKILEVVMKTLSAKHPRSFYATGYVDDFELPWREYFLI